MKLLSHHHIICVRLRSDFRWVQTSKWEKMLDMKMFPQLKFKLCRTKLILQTNRFQRNVGGMKTRETRQQKPFKTFGKPVKPHVRQMFQTSPWQHATDPTVTETRTKVKTRAAPVRDSYLAPASLCNMVQVKCSVCVQAGCSPLRASQTCRD